MINIGGRIYKENWELNQYVILLQKQAQKYSYTLPFEASEILVDKLLPRIQLVLTFSRFNYLYHSPTDVHSKYAETKQREKTRYQQLVSLKFKHLNFSWRNINSFLKVRVCKLRKKKSQWQLVSNTTVDDHTHYIISTTARPTIFPLLRSSYAFPASSNLHFLETDPERLKIPLSASLTILGRSCLALPP